MQVVRLSESEPCKEIYTKVPKYDPRYGFSCQICGSNQWDVTETRPGIGFIRRRRKCCKCDHRMTTYEVLQGDLGQLIDGEVRERLTYILKVLNRTTNKVSELMDKPFELSIGNLRGMPNRTPDPDPGIDDDDA